MNCLHTLHRRLFGRCQGCNCRLGRYRPVVLGHEPGRLFRRELGLWHEECLDGELAVWDQAMAMMGEGVRAAE